MTIFRDRRGRPVSADAYADQIRRETMSEVRSVFDNTDSFEEARDLLDERDPEPLDLDDVRQMTPEQVNNDWDRVSRVLERGPTPSDYSAPRTPEPRKATGQQLLSEGAPGSGPLTLAMVRQMSSAEVNARWPEVAALLERSR